VADWAAADINAALESALNVVWNELKYKAQVVRELAGLPPVTCIVAQLGQVFVNLLVNAAQAMQSPGTLTLRSGTLGDSVWIEISDTGQGMSEQTQARIFEPFFTTKAVGQGTGLGLSISWEIVHRHQGLTQGHQGGGVRARGPGEIPPQRHDREQADNPGHDDNGLDEAASHIAEGDPLVLPPDDREQRDRGPDDSDREDHLAAGPQQHPGVAAGGRHDVARVAENGTVEGQTRQRRDRRDDEERPRQHRGLPG